MADYDYITLNGTIVPDTAQVSQDVINEYLAAFGNDLITTPDTPQGVLISAETSSRISVAKMMAMLANQINPNIAGGVYFDAIWALTGGKRAASTPSSVICNLTGVASTVIPSGSQAKTSAGDIFQSTTIVTLNSLGEASVLFQSVEFGAIPAASGDLNTIVAPGVLGWETITNLGDATLGTSTQSDESSRALRNNELALQGTALAEAMTSGLYATAGVTSVKFQENVSDITQVINTITMVPHSIWACVAGGTDLDVATTILAKKGDGANYNGSVIVDVTEPASGQLFQVKFDRPILVPILARATVKALSSTVNPVEAVQKSILDYAAGLIAGQPGFVVGASVSPFELSGAVNIEVPGVYVQKMEVSLLSPVSYQTTEIPLNVNQQATITQTSITVILL